MVLNFYTMTPWMLVTSKDINKPQDLIGKKVAISGIRTTGYYLMIAWFKKFEINEKDVGFIMTGGTASSFASLASEQVAGASRPRSAGAWPSAGWRATIAAASCAWARRPTSRPPSCRGDGDPGGGGARPEVVLARGMRP